MLIILALVMIALAYWTRSIFLQIMSGIVCITAGVEYIAWDPELWDGVIIGAVFVGTGLYQLIMVGVDLLKGD